MGGLPTYEVLMLGVGASLVFGTWLPQRLFGRHVTLPLLHAAFGAAAAWLARDAIGVSTDPRRWSELVERLTELTVIVSLFGAGLAIAKPMRWREWTPALRLLLIGMPLTIAGVMAGGVWAGLGPASALLLGAVLAPTDPVLAASVSVPDPGGKHEDPLRFPLTGEAALNDGFAFPFVYLAVTWAEAGGGWSDLSGGMLAKWAAWELLGKIAVGLAVGAACGYAAARIVVPASQGRRLPLSGEHVGAVVLGTVLLTYALAEWAGGYGFLAAFACGAVVRRQEESADRNEALHEECEALEMTLTGVCLFLLGAAAMTLWDRIEWTDWLLAGALLFLIRPAAGFLSQVGVEESKRTRLVVAFFGIRGVGSLYYLAYAAGKFSADPDGADEAAGFAGPVLELWPVVFAAVLLSLLLHGTLATPVVGWLAKSDARVAEPAAVED